MHVLILVFFIVVAIAFTVTNNLLGISLIASTALIIWAISLATDKIVEAIHDRNK